MFWLLTKSSLVSLSAGRLWFREVMAVMCWVFDLGRGCFSCFQTVIVLCLGNKRHYGTETLYRQIESLYFGIGRLTAALLFLDSQSTSFTSHDSTK